MRYRPTTLALACLLPCILASQIPLQAQHADYKTAVPTRDSLVRLTWSTRDQAERAHAILLDQGVDVWLAKPLEITLRLKSVPGRSGEIEMGRYDSTSDVVARQLGAVGYETVLDSVQEYVETTLPTVEQARVESDAAAARMPPTRIVGTLQRATSVPDSIHDAYHPYDTLNEIMQSLADEFPGYARVVSLGQSAEGREIRGLKGEEGKVAHLTSFLWLITLTLGLAQSRMRALCLVTTTQTNHPIMLTMTAYTQPERKDIRTKRSSARLDL